MTDDLIFLWWHKYVNSWLMMAFAGLRDPFVVPLLFLSWQIQAQYIIINVHERVISTNYINSGLMMALYGWRSHSHVHIMMNHLTISSVIYQWDPSRNVRLLLNPLSDYFVVIYNIQSAKHYVRTSVLWNELNNLVNACIVIMIYIQRPWGWSYKGTIILYKTN